MRVLETFKGGYYLGFQLSHVHFKLTNKILEENLNRLYSTFVIVKISNEGAFLNYYSSLKTKDIKGLLQLYALMQVVLSHKKEYQYKEYDFNAQYLARYNKKGTFLSKSRLKYLNKSTIHIENSKIDIDIDTKHSWIQSLRLQESLTTFINNEKVVANTNHLSLKKIYQKIDNNLQVFKDKRSVKTILKSFNMKKKHSIKIWEKIEKKSLEHTIMKKNITLASLISQLNINDLKLYLSIKQEETTKLIHFIGKGDNNRDRKLIYLLETLGTTQAQQTLTELIDDIEQPQINKIRAIISLGAIKNITPKTLQYLEDTILNTQNPPLKDTTFLALGSIASSHHQEISSSIHQLLKSSLQKESSKKSILLAMQNSGAKFFQPELLSVAKEGDTLSQKVLAIKILKDIHNHTIYDFLKSTYFSSNNERIKSSTLDALTTYEHFPQLTTEIQHTIKNTTQPQLRTMMIKYLSHEIQHNPSHKEILKSLLESEQNNKNIKMIIRAIR